MNKNNLSPEDRLAIVRRGDNSRSWHSLDDERVCVRCTKTFTGHEIRIGPQRDGGYDIHCPTDGCDSIPVHWFYYGTCRASSSSLFTSYRGATL